MTRRRAEALTGCEIRCAEVGRPVRQFRCAAYDGEHLVAEQAHADLGMALAALVNAIYRRNREQVMERHGGTHRVENLEPVCWPCHGGIHKHERSK